MPTLRLETTIEAPVERVFDLARDVDTHTETMGHGERAVGGTTRGLLEAGDEVTWRARHFGVPLELTARVTEIDAPTYFRDEQVEGPFAEMVHEHSFERLGPERTRMVDEFRFSSPLGPLGTLADRLVLGSYMRRLIRRRNRELVAIVEGTEGLPHWRSLLTRGRRVVLRTDYSHRTLGTGERRSPLGASVGYRPTITENARHTTGRMLVSDDVAGAGFLRSPLPRRAWTSRCRTSTA